MVHRHYLHLRGRNRQDGCQFKASRGCQRSALPQRSCGTDAEGAQGPAKRVAASPPPPHRLSLSHPECTGNEVDLQRGGLLIVIAKARKAADLAYVTCCFDHFPGRHRDPLTQPRAVAPDVFSNFEPHRLRASCTALATGESELHGQTNEVQGTCYSPTHIRATWDGAGSVEDASTSSASLGEAS